MPEAPVFLDIFKNDKRDRIYKGQGNVTKNIFNSRIISTSLNSLTLLCHSQI